MGFTRSDLKDLDKVWKDGLSTGATESEIPEGRYQAKVKEIELGKSSGGRPQCKWVWKFIGGAVEEVIGKEHTTYDGLESAQNMGFFFKKLRRFGLKPPESFEDMEEAVQKCLGATVDIQVKIKDDFTNVYVNKLVKAGPGAAAKDAADEDEDDAKSKSKEEDEDEKPAKGSAKEAEEDDEEEAKPAKGSKKPEVDEDDDEKPAKSKAADEDEDDEKPAKGAKDEDDEEDEKPAAPARNFPTLAEIDKMAEKGVRKLLKQFKLEPAEGKKESLLKGVAKALVSVMEDDDYDAPETDLRVAAKWFGLEPAEGKKKLLRQIVTHLGG